MSEIERPRYFTERLTGQLPAPVQRVWQQWSEIEQIEQWYAEPHHALTLSELAPERRGEYSLTVITDRPRLEFISHGTIIVLDPPDQFLIRGNFLFARRDEDNSIALGVKVRGGEEFFLSVRLSDEDGRTREDAELTCATRPFNHRFIAGWWGRCLDRRSNLLRLESALDL